MGNCTHMVHKLPRTGGIRLCIFLLIQCRKIYIERHIVTVSFGSHFIVATTPFRLLDLFYFEKFIYIEHA